MWPVVVAAVSRLDCTLEGLGLWLMLQGKVVCRPKATIKM